MKWSDLLLRNGIVGGEIIHPEFHTHLNYVQFLERESSDLTLSFGNELTKSICSEDVRLKKKIKIINVTLANIQSEHKSVVEEPEYSEVCCAWIPVKSYYLIFHTLLVLEYLLQCDGEVLISGHDESRRKLRAFLADRTLNFNKPIFNEICSSEEAMSWSVSVGANLRTTNADPDEYKRLILRKLFDYKKEEIKRNSKIKRLTRKALESSGFFKANMTLFDFFYFYRIKVNYRDLEFMQEGLSHEQYKDFYMSYVELTYNLATIP